MHDIHVTADLVTVTKVCLTIQAGVLLERGGGDLHDAPIENGNGIVTPCIVVMECQNKLELPMLDPKFCDAAGTILCLRMLYRSLSHLLPQNQ